MQAWQAESPHFSAFGRVVLGQQPIIAFKHPSSADRQFARPEEFIKRMYLVMHGSASEKPTFDLTSVLRRLVTYPQPVT